LPERVLSLRELNRALLARQLLLERARLPLPGALERLGALQAQWSQSPYVALWSRLEGFRIEHLERALADGDAVKATLMRSTLHIVSRADYWAFAAALREARLDRARQRFPGLDLSAVTARLLEAAAEGPVDRLRFYETIRALAGREVRLVELWPLWTTLLLHAELVHEPPSGTYGFFRAGTLAPAPRRLGPRPALEGAPLDHLVRRYLTAFGPASVDDVSSWTGLNVADLRPALASLRLRTFRDERGRLLHDLPRAPLPPADTPAPARLLPKWDSALLAYAPPERERILPERYRKTVIRKNGDVLPTFLVDGFVAGTWTLGKRRIDLEPFARLPQRARKELEAEADRLLETIASRRAGSA
jgi:hypothetical protein